MKNGINIGAGVSKYVTQFRLNRKMFKSIHDWLIQPQSVMLLDYK